MFTCFNIFTSVHLITYLHLSSVTLTTTANTPTCPLDSPMDNMEDTKLKSIQTVVLNRNNKYEKYLKLICVCLNSSLLIPKYSVTVTVIKLFFSSSLYVVITTSRSKCLYLFASTGSRHSN